jgi:hypothetical protein
MSGTSTEYTVSLPSPSAAERTPSHAALLAGAPVEPVAAALVDVAAAVELLAELADVDEPAVVGAAAVVELAAVVGGDVVLVFLSDPHAARTTSGITTNVMVARRRRSTESPF